MQIFISISQFIASSGQKETLYRMVAGWTEAILYNKLNYRYISFRSGIQVLYLLFGVKSCNLYCSIVLFELVSK